MCARALEFHCFGHCFPVEDGKISHPIPYVLGRFPKRIQVYLLKGAPKFGGSVGGSVTATYNLDGSEIRREGKPVER